jgi:hypothetical protein
MKFTKKLFQKLILKFYKLKINAKIYMMNGEKIIMKIKTYQMEFIKEQLL